MVTMTPPITPPTIAPTLLSSLSLGPNSVVHISLLEYNNINGYMWHLGFFIYFTNLSSTYVFLMQ